MKYISSIDIFIYHLRVDKIFDTLFDEISWRNGESRSRALKIKN